MTRKLKKTIGIGRLKELLGIKKLKLDELIAEGLPHDNYRFDRAEVLQWLTEHYPLGPEDAPDTIITTRAAFAKRMGVTPSAVLHWETKDDFPGSKNNYPLQACIEWKENQVNQAGAPSKIRSEADNRLTDLRAQKLETEIRLKKGELVPLDDVADYLRRSVARHREILRAFPDRLAKKFSERGFDRDTTDFCRREAAAMIDDLQKQIHNDLIEHAEEDIATE